MCDDAVMTLKEVSEFLKIGPTTIYTLARNKKIPARKIGREWRFLKSEILQWIKDRHGK
jgi:excisionase family DNA binding protein